MLRYALAALVSLSVATAANADPLTVSSVEGGIATGPNLNFMTFDGPSSSSVVTIGLINSQIVSGSEVGVYVAPYFSNNEGAVFGQSPTNGPDATNYLAIEKGGAATFTFATPQSYFGLLWGSADSYNTLSFYNASGNLIETITGNDVQPGANGDQAADGTYYVNIYSDELFTTVVARSSANAFEIDDVAYDPPPAEIPEPAPIIVFGSLIGFFVLRYLTSSASRAA